MKTKMFLSIALCLIISCQKSESPPGPNEEPKPNKPEEPTYVTSSSVGISGGKLNDLSIDLEIPAGCFSQPKTVQITKSSSGTTMGTYESSTFYKVSGIPVGFSKPLQVKLSPSEGSPENLLVSVTEQKFIPSLQKMVSTTQFLPFTKSGNKYNFEYQPFESSANLPDSTLTLTFGLVKNYEELPTTKAPSKFKIHAPINLRVGAFELRDHLDRIFTELENMQFSFSKRTSWPMSVTVKVFSTDQQSVYGYFAQSPWGHNYSSLEFNGTHINNNRELIATAGHELFHFAQSLYNPQGALSKMVKSDPFYWLDEACSVWFEQVALMDPSYTPLVRNGHHMEPIVGVYKGPAENAEHYGYGMAAFIKYLVSINDNLSLSKIYNKIIDGSAKNPKEAIEGIYPNIFSQNYPKFIEEYFGRTIYSDFAPSSMLAHASEGFSIRSSSDTIKTISKEYEAYSASIFRVDFSYTGLKKEDNLSISSNAIGQFLVYKVQGANITLLGKAYEEFIVGDLKDLLDNNARLLVVRPNSSDSKEEIKVNFKVERGLNIDAVWAKLYVQGAFTGDINSSISVEFPLQVSSDDWPKYPMLKGSYNSKTKVFTASYSGNSIVCNFDTKNNTLSGSLSFSNSDFTFKERNVTANVTFSGLPLIIWDDKHVTQYLSGNPKGSVVVGSCQFTVGEAPPIGLISPTTVNLYIYFGRSNN